MNGPSTVKQVCPGHQAREERAGNKPRTCPEPGLSPYPPAAALSSLVSPSGHGGGGWGLEILLVWAGCSQWESTSALRACGAGEGGVSKDVWPQVIVHHHSNSPSHIWGHLLERQRVRFPQSEKPHPRNEKQPNDVISEVLSM